MPSNTHYTSSNPSIGTAAPKDRDVLLQVMQDNIMVTKEVVASTTQAVEKQFNKIDASIVDVKKTLQKQSAMLEILSEERQKQSAMLEILSEERQKQSTLLERLSDEMSVPILFSFTVF
ncbi:hypothetical protein K439DRAFT_1616922 [Ramaria rubella]|nr:hypothetical protein K439DRAFT_1616922 [Ramaria rubella]